MSRASGINGGVYTSDHYATDNIPLISFIAFHSVFTQQGNQNSMAKQASLDSDMRHDEIMRDEFGFS